MTVDDAQNILGGCVWLQVNVPRGIFRGGGAILGSVFFHSQD